VAGRERVRAEDHPALDLGAEAFAAGPAIRLEQVGAFDTKAVADPVVAREIRGCLGRLDDVVDREAVVGQRERDLLELCAFALEHLQRVAHRALDAGLHAFDREVLLRHAEAHPLDALVQVAAEIVVRKVRDHGRVVRVFTGPNAEFSFELPIANSSRFVLPTMTAPCASRRSTTVAEYTGTYPSRMRDPAVVGIFFVPMMSLHAHGIPVRSGASPRRRRSSAARACSRA